jgi:arginase
MKDIDRSGIACRRGTGAEIAGAGTGGVHVSFDLDVCDPAIAPGVGTPVKGGPRLSRGAHGDGDRGRFGPAPRALDLVEVNPILDRSQHDGCSLVPSSRHRHSVRKSYENHAHARVCDCVLLSV